MSKNKNLITTFLVVSFAASSNLWCMKDVAPGPESAVEASWPQRFKTFAKNNHSELTNLLLTLMHAPYILTVDSTDQKVIRLTSMLAGAATAAKIGTILAIPQHVPPAKILVWDLPKVTGYALAATYDVIRFLDAATVVLKNQTEGPKLRMFKINQGMQLTIELMLRVMALLSTQKNIFDGNSKAVSLCATELADIVSIWRLLSRYMTYFVYLHELEFKFSINQKSDVPHDAVEQAIEAHAQEIETAVVALDEPNKKN